MAVSHNGGLTWKRMDDGLPEGFTKHKNCPGIYRMIDKKTGKVRFWFFSAWPVKRLIDADFSAYSSMAASKNGNILNSYINL